jgi:F-type H+-transporting ATPase subunit a
MEEHKLLIVQWVNDVFGGPIASLLGLHVQPGKDIIPTHVVMETVVVLVCFVVFGLVRSRLSVEAPGRLQQAFEVFVEFLNDQLEANIGHEGHKYLNIVGTLAVFILLCNLIGLVPGMTAPTSNINVPAGCALTVWVFYHYQGVRKQGILKYLRHFMGPILALAPLMFLIEMISHAARALSLTIRLFANIYAEESVIAVFFSLVAFAVPLPFMIYAIFGGLLQTFIFVTLTMVYLGGAVATEEH